jgi:Cu/Ag efflux pump CusA
MAGGLVSSFALELLAYPALFALWKSARLPARLAAIEQRSQR